LYAYNEDATGIATSADIIETVHLFSSLTPFIQQTQQLFGSVLYSVQADWDFRITEQVDPVPAS
jgi:hypothetical protein